ncbi:hypothetical protein TcWFU_008247 [Taenia crassiceps]|uniref:Uncharacterized protein n=1 Tax=Taenia crassiceps TaxID=6207 RepID=A0ABR4Q8F0_9CEST
MHKAVAHHFASSRTSSALRQCSEQTLHIKVDGAEGLDLFQGQTFVLLKIYEQLNLGGERTTTKQRRGRRWPTWGMFNRTLSSLEAALALPPSSSTTGEDLRGDTG